MTAVMLVAAGVILALFASGCLIYVAYKERNL